MSITRRKQFSLRATVGYAVFAGAWILLSDRALETFSDPHTLSRFSTLKGLVFIAVTTALLWFTLQNVPPDTDTLLADQRSRKLASTRWLWGVVAPLMAWLLQWVFWSTLDPFAWLLFYPAVFVASWLGGWLSGSLATTLSSVLAWHFFIPHTLTGAPNKPTLVIAVGTFFAMGLLMSLIIEWLRQSEQQSGNNKFEALVEQSLAGIYIAQQDRLRYVNPEFARIFGYDRPEQIIDQVPISDMLMPQDRTRVLGQLKEQLENLDQKIRYTTTGIRRDGLGVELDVHGRSIQTTTGPAVIGLILDITEQRRSEQLLRAVVEGTTDAVFVKDLEGRYLMANQACANLLGRPIESILSKDDLALFPVEVGERIKQRDRTIMQSAAASTHEEQLPLLDGKLHTFLVTKGPMLDANGLVIGLFGISRDISDMVAAQAALREKQALLDSMSTLAKVGGWGIDIRTMHGTRTNGAARILDLDPTLPESINFTDGLRYFHGEHRDKLKHAMRCAIEQGQAYALELELTSAKGVRKWIRTQGEPVWLDGKVVRIEGALQDISEVHQARAALQAHQEVLEQTVQERTVELEAARQEAERLMRIKSEFLANMSHEIRTPLNGVLGLAQIGYREHTDSARKVFGQINTAGRLLLGVINDILDFSKIEAGKLRLELSPINLEELLTRTTAMVQERATEKGLRLVISLSDHLETTCVSDALRLEQILLNLMSNAVKFTATGEVCVSATTGDGKLVLTVTDTGIGMTAEQVERLFRPFEQADGSTTRQYGGTGLGLTISKRLVEMLGGEIHIDSHPDRGTRFEVVLPLVLGDPTTQAALIEEPHPPEIPLEAHQPRLQGLRILAAEDNAINQLVLAEFLKLEGADVTMSDSGVSAMSHLEKNGAQAYDIVLMDIQMPLMDGYEATRLIKTIAPNLAIIGQTAHAMSEEHAKCLAAGMVDLVVKPIDLEKLVHTIQKHVKVSPSPNH